MVKACEGRILESPLRMDAREVAKELKREGWYAWATDYQYHSSNRARAGKREGSAAVSDGSLLERVTTAADERHLSQNTLTAYRRTWLKLIAWAAAEGLALETLSSDRAGEFYKEATRGRSASHHLQVKAALALLYDVLDTTNPFAERPAPKFAPEKTELRYHTASQLGQLLRELREDRGSYFGRLTYHLATALFFTGCRSRLTIEDGLVRRTHWSDYCCTPPGQRRWQSGGCSGSCFRPGSPPF